MESSSEVEDLTKDFHAEDDLHKPVSDSFDTPPTKELKCKLYFVSMDSEVNKAGITKETLGEEAVLF